MCILSLLELDVERGHTQVALVLIESGANLKCVDNHGWTPLHIAARLSRTLDFQSHTPKGQLHATAARGSVDLTLFL